MLVTSRRQQWDRSLGVQSVPISTLPRPASIELLRKFRPDVPQEDPALLAIAAELGDLPLALHLAGSFLERYAEAPDGQPAAYLEALRQGGLLQHPSLQGKFAGISPTDHEAHVGRTFALSIEKLKPEDETDALALALLARAAYFAPGDPNNFCDTNHFWSFHPGLAHWAFADGTVRSIPYNAYRTVMQLSTRAGGELVNLGNLDKQPVPRP